MRSASATNLSGSLPMATPSRLPPSSRLGDLRLLRGGGWFVVPEREAEQHAPAGGASERGDALEVLRRDRGVRPRGLGAFARPGGFGVEADAAEAHHSSSERAQQVDEVALGGVRGELGEAADLEGQAEEVVGDRGADRRVGVDGHVDGLDPGLRLVSALSRRGAALGVRGRARRGRHAAESQRERDQCHKELRSARRARRGRRAGRRGGRRRLARAGADRRLRLWWCGRLGHGRSG